MKTKAAAKVAHGISRKSPSRLTSAREKKSFARVKALSESLALRHDAHVKAYAAEFLFALKVREWREADGTARPDRAVELMSSAARCLRHGVPMTDALRMWLAEALSAASRTRDASAAFGTEVPRRSTMNVAKRLRNAALVHALIYWHQASQIAAARAAEEVADVDSSVLVKDHNYAKKNWRIDGPFNAQAEGVIDTTRYASASDLNDCPSKAGDYPCVLMTFATMDSLAPSRRMLHLPKALASCQL